MNDLKITEVNIEPIDNQEGLVGFASFVINGDFKISNVGIYTCPSHTTGLRLTFPTKEYDGAYRQLIKPINQATYECIATAVAYAYRKLIDKLR